MNKFETELGNWVSIIKTYVAESSQISQRIRRILRKNTNKETDEFIRVFGKLYNINYIILCSQLKSISDNFYLENEAKLMKSLFAVDNYLGKGGFISCPVMTNYFSFIG